MKLPCSALAVCAPCVLHDRRPPPLARLRGRRCRWYGPGEPKLCFIERKTHRESWKGEKSVKERFTLPEPKARPPARSCNSASPQ